MSNTRDALVESAAQLLDAGGVEAVTLREVGRLVGVSHNAPYKHFAGKETLLAAIAARELRGLRAAFADSVRREPTPRDALRAVLHGYIEWTQRHPERFKLVFKSWTIDSAELGEAAQQAQSAFVDLVSSGQEAAELPPGDPERLASLLRALAHGAADLALAGHLAAHGKGRAEPGDLVDDLLEHLRGAAAA
ncbi:TetR/AcrR family transcriptional regulator [Glycomyces albus]